MEYGAAMLSTASIQLAEECGRSHSGKAMLQDMVSPFLDTLCQNMLAVSSLGTRIRVLNVSDRCHARP